MATLVELKGWNDDIELVNVDLITYMRADTVAESSTLIHFEKDHLISVKGLPKDIWQKIQEAQRQQKINEQNWSAQMA